MQQQQTQQRDRLLRRPEVESLVGLRRSAIYNAINRGEFPRPVQITSRAVGWRESEIEAWLAARPVAG